jgi:hypothetical protein
MKLFVTWSPYDVSGFLEEFIDGYSVQLGCLSRDLLEKSMLVGLRKALGTTKEVLVDSLVTTISSAAKHPLLSKSQSHIFNIQLWLNPDYIVHKDYPVLNKELTDAERRKLVERTVLNAEVLMKLMEKYGLDERKVIFVIQGWDKKSIKWCAKRYAEIGVEMYGLGSSIKTSPGAFLERLMVVRGVIGERAHLHVFGALKPSVLRAAKDLYDSVDTSTPLKAAAMGYVIVFEEGRVKRVRVDNVSLEDLRIPLPLKREVERVVDELGSMHEERLPITRLKRLLAAVNVYELRRALC